MKPMTFNLGNTVYKEGDDDMCLYMIVKGELEISELFEIPKGKTSVKD